MPTLMIYDIIMIKIIIKIKASNYLCSFPEGFWKQYRY